MATLVAFWAFLAFSRHLSLQREGGRERGSPERWIAPRRRKKREREGEGEREREKWRKKGRRRAPSGLDAVLSITDLTHGREANHKEPVCGESGGNKPRAYGLISCPLETGIIWVGSHIPTFSLPPRAW